MSAEDLEKYETEMELKLYREYRDVVGLFKFVIETERRFYLTNDYDMQVHSVQGEVFFEVSMADAWVWDMYRPARFVKQVRVLTFKDVNIEELNKSDLELPGGEPGGALRAGFAGGRGARRECGVRGRYGARELGFCGPLRAWGAERAGPVRRVAGPVVALRGGSEADRAVSGVPGVRRPPSASVSPRSGDPRPAPAPLAGPLRSPVSPQG